MALIEALDDLKLELVAGKAASEVIVGIAEDHDLKPAFLTNRAIAVLGDLNTYADRAAAARVADKANVEGAKRKIALARVKAQIEAHNDGTARVSDGQLELLITAANQLGANYQLVRRGQRRPVDAGAQFDRDLMRLFKMLMGTK
jgi:hypothetical protein